MIDIIAGLIVIAIIGFIIGLIVLTAQFTVNNIGSIVVLIAIGAIVYLIYQGLKPSQKPIKEVTIKQPVRNATPVNKYKIPKPLKSIIEWIIWLIISYIITSLALIAFGFLDHSTNYPMWSVYAFPAIPFLITLVLYLIGKIISKYSGGKKHTNHED